MTTTRNGNPRVAHAIMADRRDATRSDKQVQPEQQVFTLDPTGEPNLAPLKQVIPPNRVKDYMWMGSRGTIECYKHRDTRRYLYLDAVTGQAYLHMDSDTLSPTPLHCALDDVRGVAAYEPPR